MLEWEDTTEPCERCELKERRARRREYVEIVFSFLFLLGCALFFAILCFFVWGL